MKFSGRTKGRRRAAAFVAAAGIFAAAVAGIATSTASAADASTAQRGATITSTGCVPGR